MFAGDVQLLEYLKLANVVLFQIGYCPQFDALLDYLTVQEHLELYARIKRVPDQRINDVRCQNERFFAIAILCLLKRWLLTEYSWIDIDLDYRFFNTCMERF